MTKVDLTKSVAEALSITQAKAEQAVKVIFDEMAAALAKGEEVTIHGFGNFSVKMTHARTGRNPQTGEPLEIPAGKKVRFNPAKALKDVIK